MTRPPGEYGQGPLHRVATVTYWFLVVELLLVATTAPGLVAAVLLDRDASNIPLYALAAVPAGPALAATLFAWRAFLRERDLAPAAEFWRGYRLGWRDALRSWVPALAGLVVLGLNLAYGGAVGFSGAFTVLYAVMAVLLLLWALRMLSLAATFSFRWRDAARLGLYTLTARPLVTLRLLSFVVLAGGIAFVTFDAVVVLLGSVLTFLVARNEAPVVADVAARYVRPDPGQ